MANNASTQGPTPEQLRMALRHLQRPGWPDTLEAVLAHPTYGVCLRGLARNLSRAAWGATRTQPASGSVFGRQAPPAPPTPTEPAARRPPTKPTRPRIKHTREANLFDAKRAAANDLDRD